MQHELKLWDYIRSSDFKVPASPANEAARSHSRRLWRWLTEEVLSRSDEDASNVSTPFERPSLSELEFVPLRPDWSQAARALATEMDQWFDNSRPDHRAVRVLVGPPGCEVSSVLQALAREQHLRTVAAPPPEAILDDCAGDQITSQLAEDSADDVLVIPHLERFYLRHEDGLTLVRNLAERFTSRRRLLLGCDSWAWAFLQQAIGIEDMLGAPMTMAPFDAQRLDRWFRSNNELHQLEFRQSHDDKSVFPTCADQSDSDNEQSPPETSGLIKSLAGRARGNLGVALALWRFGLRTRDADSADSAPPTQSARPVYWVVSPSELELPKLPAGMQQVHRFILHALLLHGGLSLSMLVTVLPFSREEVRRRVSELHAAGVLEEHNDTLCVALTAYPNVRQDLIDGGFLADAF